MPAKKKERTQDNEVLIPASKKDIDISVKKTTIPMVTQRFVLVPIKFTAPLIMDRKSKRIEGQIILDAIEKRDRSMAKELKIHAETVDPSPFQSFYEAIWQFKGPTQMQRIKTPCVTPGPIGSGILHEPGFEIDFDISPGFTTTALKAAMVRAAKTLFMTKQTDNKAFTNIVKECVHAQGKVFPIEFDEIKMETFPVAGGHVKFLPVFYGARAKPLISWYHPVINFQDVMTIFCNAGLMCGAGCRRPELGGQNGTWELDGKPEEISKIKAEAWIEKHSTIEDGFWVEIDETVPERTAAKK